MKEENKTTLAKSLVDKFDMLGKQYISIGDELLVSKSSYSDEIYYVYSINGKKIGSSDFVMILKDQIKWI